MESFEVTSEQGPLYFSEQMCSNFIERMVEDGQLIQPDDKIDTADDNYSQPEDRSYYETLLEQYQIFMPQD